eukprot:13964-Eustigmatos_ZCMA.PRE.1
MIRSSTANVTAARTRAKSVSSVSRSSCVRDHKLFNVHAPFTPRTSGYQSSAYQRDTTLRSESKTLTA